MNWIKKIEIGFFKIGFILNNVIRDLRLELSAIITKQKISRANLSNKKKHAKKFSFYLQNELLSNSHNLDKELVLKIEKRIKKAVRDLNYPELFLLSEIFDFVNKKEKEAALISFINQKQYNYGKH